MRRPMCSVSCHGKVRHQGRGEEAPLPSLATPLSQVLSLIWQQGRQRLLWLLTFACRFRVPMI